MDSVVDPWWQARELCQDQATTLVSLSIRELFKPSGGAKDWQRVKEWMGAQVLALEAEWY